LLAVKKKSVFTPHTHTHTHTHTQILLNQRKVEVLQDDREKMGTDRNTL